MNGAIAGELCAKMRRKLNRTIMRSRGSNHHFFRMHKNIQISRRIESLGMVRC